MSTNTSKARKLSTFVKCNQCRQDRQKCERPSVSQKCFRCAKYNHDCDAGRASNRAQCSQRRAVRQRTRLSDRTATATSTAPYDLSAAAQYQNRDQDIVNLKVEESSSSQTSRSASSERSTSFSTPSTQEDSYSLGSFEGDLCHGRQDSACSFSNVPNLQHFNNSPSISEDGVAFAWEPVSWAEPPDTQRVFEYTDEAGEFWLDFDPSPPTIGAAVHPSAASDVMVRVLSGLTNMQPSRHYVPTLFEERLDNRINRLWGNYKTFATANSKGLKVTPLFGRTLSELFSQSRQIAETDDLVRDVRHACGAADACMNTKIPAHTRAQYFEAYHRYDCSANIKFKQAVDEFDRRINADESPDVLPLYIAAFLYYAAGACMKGMIALRSAPYAFNYFNKYTAWFPIRVEISMDLEGLWTVDMLLANNDQDPGMKINTLMFALGKARLAFDREEGLC